MVSGPMTWADDEVLLAAAAPIQSLLTGEPLELDEPERRHHLVDTLDQTIQALQAMAGVEQAESLKSLDWAARVLLTQYPDPRPSGMNLFLTDPIAFNLRTVIESSPNSMGAFRLAGDGIRLLALNQRSHEMTGYEESYLLSIRFQDHYHPDDIPRFADFFSQIARERRGTLKGVRLKVSDAAPVKFRDGDHYYVWVDIHAGFYPRTEYGYFELINVTERQQAIQLNEVLESVLRSTEIPLTVFEIREQGFPLGLVSSSGFAELLGYPKGGDGMREIQVADVIPREKFGELRRHMAMFKQTGSMEWLGAPMRRADGEIVPIDISARASTVRDRTYAIAVYEDTQKRLDAAEERRQAVISEYRQQTARGMAHNLNNHVTTILAHITLALEFGGPPTLVGLSKTLRDVDHHVNLMIGTISDFRSTADRRKGPVNLHDLLSRGDVEIGTGGDVTIAVDLVDDPPLVMGPLNQLWHLLMSFFKNAREAMDDMKQVERELSVKTENVRVTEAQLAEWDVSQRFPDAQSGEYLCLTLRDSGPGIAPEVQHNLFREGVSTKQGVHGRGIGLAYAQELVADRNGFIRVSSVEGEGATFSIYLPALSLES